jgi:hypothetical protein
VGKNGRDVGVAMDNKADAREKQNNKVRIMCFVKGIYHFWGSRRKGGYAMIWYFFSFFLLFDSFSEHTRSCAHTPCPKV